MGRFTFKLKDTITLICVGCGYQWTISKFWARMKLAQRQLRCPVCQGSLFVKKRYVDRRPEEKNEFWKKLIVAQYPDTFKGKWDEDKFKEIKPFLGRKWKIKRKC